MVFQTAVSLTRVCRRVELHRTSGGVTTAIAGSHAIGKGCQIFIRRLRRGRLEEFVEPPIEARLGGVPLVGFYRL